ELPGDDDLALGIHAMDLEHLLCKVEPDGGNSCHGRPSLVIRRQRSLYGTLMPREAPSTSSKAVVSPKPKARRNFTPAPSMVGVDWIMLFTGRMDMLGSLADRFKRQSSGPLALL